MTLTATYPSKSSAIPTPSRRTDVFDFLHSAKQEKTRKERIRVQKLETNELVAVTLERPDGRSIRRNVVKARWQEKDYRSALIRNMRTLAA